MEPRKLRLELIFFYSPLQEFRVLAESRRSLLESLEERFKLSVIPYNKISADHFADPDKIYLPFIASGGCEEIFQSYSYSLPLPLIFLYDHMHNSLPAALELATYFSEGKLNVPMIFSENEIQPEMMEVFYRMQHTVRKLKKIHIALIGGPSPWLLSNHVDSEALTRMFGMHFQSIDIASLVDSYKQHTKLSRDNVTIYQKILKNASGMTHCTKEDVYDSVRMYQSLDDLLVYHSCNALTIKCFDLLNECNVTACTALALFNQEGIPAACEGDLPSLLSMIFAGELTGEPVFMANPIDFDREQNTIDIAHCSVPFSMPQDYAFNSHFESGVSVGVEGYFTPGEPYTIVKWIGKRLERFFVSQGVTVESEHTDYKCRTQMKLQLEQPLADFHLNGMGNHVLLVKGKHLKVFSDWNQYMIYRR
jgi:L-fucose isomerase-like protein